MQKPAERYAQTRYRNFVASSKLEGLLLPQTPPRATLGEVLAKHRQ